MPSTHALATLCTSCCMHKLQSLAGLPNLPHRLQALIGGNPCCLANTPESASNPTDCSHIPPAQRGQLQPSHSNTLEHRVINKLQPLGPSHVGSSPHRLKQKKPCASTRNFVYILPSDPFSVPVGKQRIITWHLGPPNLVCPSESNN